ncbi:FtsJ-like methyltransferase-domain-containing protein [Zychaea mexicana]|uniref:FtsJ-like methyltransferase-domain-containing protein n=1 Tax=Zychaea mexicana TaxID=64656 RepID=UPI0022FEC212|nr:FtsJ-like methyltransferase-domain-containing protein [Zychaea mexicana]KAI9495312.1 FtsJ-like methyltransferase-domain-containing protein [Zychaea mexicana]
MSVGFDHVDVAALRERNIPLGYTPDVLTDATADLTVLLTLAAARRMKEGMSAAANGEWGAWRPTWLCGSQFTGKTLGVIGMGRIGEAVAHRLKPFGVSRILYWGRREKPELQGRLPGAEFKASLDDVLAEADYVVVFVNTARGGIVQQDDLTRALEENLIASAGLDVTTPEPLSPDHKLYKLPNCVIVPHIGNATFETRERMAAMCVENVYAALNNQNMPYKFAFKLIQLDQKYKLLRKGYTVIDCGAAPGGWTQYAAEKVKKDGCVIGIDLLPMDPVPNAHIIKGDFMRPVVRRKILELIEERPVDLVCSDMAPSFSGNHMADHARSIELCEAVLAFAQTVLAPNGSFVAKVLMGGDWVEFRQKLRSQFTKVKQEKPHASRKQSTEIFLVATGFKIDQDNSSSSST